VIFITAYDQHAVRAFELNALDYLLKPVATARFAAALARLAPPAGSAPPFPAPTAPQPARLDDQILLKLDSATERFVRIADIRTIAASENYTEVTLAHGEKFFVRRTMKSWEDLLPPADFGRVHRTVIVALAHIERITRLNRATFEVHLRGQRAPLPVSYRIIPELRARLGTRWPEI
jgi:two-component system LytT family response regulator